MNPILYVLTLLISIPVILVYGDLVDDKQWFLEKGDEFFLKGNIHDAISFYDKVLEVEPEHVDALFNKGRALDQINQTAEAFSYIENVLELEPDNIDALAFKGNYLVINDKPDDAIEYYNRILELEPDNIDALAFKGDYLVMNGKQDEAIWYYENLLKINPKHVNSFEEFYADKALEIEPNNVKILNAKGSSEISLGRGDFGYTMIFLDKVEEAIQYYDKALDIEPDNIDVLFNKARALVQLNQTAEGYSHIDRILEIEPDNIDALSYLGDQLVGDGMHEEGMFYIEKVLEQDPNHETALFVKGIYFMTQDTHDSYTEAFSIFDQVLAINPTHQLALENSKRLGVSFGREDLDGFLEVKVRDLNTNLVAHMKINKLSVLNHDIGKDFVNSWPVTNVVNRNGTDYEVLQYETSKDVLITGRYYGGSQHYGISYPHSPLFWKVYANYWQYEVQKGDEITFVYTVFRSL